MRLRPHLRRIPAVIGAVLLGVCWFYLVWNTTVGELAPKLRFRTKQTIAGVLAEAAPKITPKTILDYTVQRYISEAIGRLSPVYASAIHWKSEFDYGVLGMSTNAVVGRGRQLFQEPYLVEYCARDMTTFVPKAREWAARIRAIQDRLQARGKIFLYVLTPSKVATYPEWIPTGYGCPSTQADRDALLPTWTKLLDDAGVVSVNAAALIHAQRRQHGVDLFARGGIHWNQLGAAIAADAITRKIDELTAAPTLTPFSYTYSITDHPVGTDRDMIIILNLPIADDRYPVPAMTYASTAPQKCDPAQIAIVGGSFMFTVNDVLAKQACPPRLNEWWYWKYREYSYPPAEPEPKMDVDPAARRDDILNRAKIVIYEENEANVPRPGHGVALDEFLTEEAR